MAIVDLHLHTTASDGRLTPTELVRLVAERGLQTVAITDHDTTEGLAEAFQAASAYPQLRIIPGIELSIDLSGADVHLLGYFIDPGHSDLQETLARYRLGRVERARQMVQKLNELGIMIEWERVAQLAGEGAVGRPHIALAMKEKGYVEQPRDAFTHYLGHNGLAHVEREKLPPRESARLITEAGGVPVLAHPAYLTQLDAVIEELKGYGLVGMEVHYAEYAPDTIAELATVASRYGLVPCGGSDYHAMGNPNEPLPGELGPPPQVVEQLERLAKTGQGNPRL